VGGQRTSAKLAQPARGTVALNAVLVRLLFAEEALVRAGLALPPAIDGCHVLCHVPIDRSARNPIDRSARISIDTEPN